MTLSGVVESIGFKDNIARISASDQTDSITSNNVASADLTPRQIDLELAKRVDNRLPNVGEAVTFVITVTNQEDEDATAVQIRDELPEGMRIASPSDITATAGTYNPTNGVWNVGTVFGRQQ